jgi:glyoxylase-like metal-dependent hydrolase (beta-lactamase superfamily II)
MWPDGLRTGVPREVTDGVYLLEVGWPEPVGANAYLVDDGDLTLVDAGLPVGRRRLTAEIAAAGYDPTDLDRVLVTHYDVDHVGGLRAVARDVPTYLGAPDVALVDRSWAPPLSHPKGPYHRLVRRVFSLSGRDVRPVLDGEGIGEFRALLTPGHNPGHTVYVHDALDTAFLGDVVRATGDGFRQMPSIDTYDAASARESIARVGTESFTHGCAGHGRPVTRDAGAALATLAEEL